MDGERGPKAELILAQVQSVANRGEDKQGDGIEQEDRSHGDADLFLIRTGDRGDGGDRTSATDGGAGCDQERRLSGNFKHNAKQQAKQYGTADANRGVEKPRTACVHHLLQIHAEPQGNDRRLQQKLGQ